MENYIIMHAEQEVASIRTDGACHLLRASFMPYNLYFEEVAADSSDLELRMQNLDNFYHWCATRVLTLDRQYAKELLNSIGATQSATDRDRAGIALSYHCLSLTDVYWVKSANEAVTFASLNLYENHLSTAFVDLALLGKPMTIQNRHLIADDLGTQGVFPKAWIREADSFFLLKDGGADAVNHELLASRIARCFSVNQVLYEPALFDGQPVTKSRLITSPATSIVPMEHYILYSCNQETDWMQEILNLDGYSYHMMNIIDYLVGNTDRHRGNWGVLVDNQTNLPLRLHDLMDFNQTFLAYDTCDGANCQTTKDFGVCTQLEAAKRGVREVGLNQVREVPPEWFVNVSQNVREMFFKRLALLKQIR